MRATDGSSAAKRAAPAVASARMNASPEDRASPSMAKPALRVSTKPSVSVAKWKPCTTPAGMKIAAGLTTVSRRSSSAVSTQPR